MVGLQTGWVKCSDLTLHKGIKGVGWKEFSSLAMRCMLCPLFSCSMLYLCVGSVIEMAVRQHLNLNNAELLTR